MSPAQFVPATAHDTLALDCARRQVPLAFDWLGGKHKPEQGSEKQRFFTDAVLVHHQPLQRL
ncbi:MAG: hypothetical protein RMH97_08795 [Verrucomicrobiales bacterium]|nr:hypothetical protein [Verrucomicrobiales bacterium]